MVQIAKVAHLMLTAGAALRCKLYQGFDRTPDTLTEQHLASTDSDVVWLGKSACSM